MSRIFRPPSTAACCAALSLLLLALPACGHARETSPTATPSLGDTRVRQPGAAVMVYVPAGTFEMGSSDAQIDEIMRACAALEPDAQQSCRREHYETAQPVHAATLDAFWIDQTEVTNAQFAEFLNECGNQTEDGVQWFEPGKYGLIERVDGEYRPRPGFEHHPVIEVSWYGAAAYCAWVGGRLPTEAEWEYAARGTQGSVYPWGDAFDGTLVNYRDASFTFQNFGADLAYNDGHPQWAPVGSYAGGASWCGVYDMAGNVWEWVGDRWSSDYYAHSPTHNPPGPAFGELRIARGGSWFDASYRVRSDVRKALSPSSRRMHWVGFRCVIPANP